MTVPDRLGHGQPHAHALSCPLRGGERSMTAVRWDQRAVARVTVQGTSTDQNLFTSAVTDRGWLALESDVPDGLTALAAGRARYTVEVRFPGSPYRAVNGARQQ